MVLKKYTDDKLNIYFKTNFPEKLRIDKELFVDYKKIYMIASIENQNSFVIYKNEFK